MLESRLHLLINLILWTTHQQIAQCRCRDYGSYQCCAGCHHEYGRCNCRPGYGGECPPGLYRQLRSGSGVLETYSNGSYPQTPDIISTPRSTNGHAPDRDSFDFVPTIPYNSDHPRKSAEPSLNQWLANMMPDPDDVQCLCRYTDRTDNATKETWISLQTLGFSPIDLLYLLNHTGQAALTRIDDRLIHYIYKTLRQGWIPIWCWNTSNARRMPENIPSLKLCRWCEA